MLQGKRRGKHTWKIYFAMNRLDTHHAKTSSRMRQASIKVSRIGNGGSTTKPSVTGGIHGPWHGKPQKTNRRNSGTEFIEEFGRDK